MQFNMEDLVDLVSSMTAILKTMKTVVDDRDEDRCFLMDEVLTDFEV